MSNTQLLDMNKFNTDTITFSEPVIINLPNGLEAKRINMYVKNEDGTLGGLVLPTSKLFSFGLQEDKSIETGQINGYTLPLCLWDSAMGKPKDTEQLFYNTFNAICKSCINHLLENKFDLDLCDLERSDLEKDKGGFNPLYWKREVHTDNKGKKSLKRVEGSSPTLYVKMMYSKKTDTFQSRFYDENDKEMNPKEMMGKYCFATSAVKVESIFIGQKPSLQLKIYESTIDKIEKKTRPRLL